MCKVLVLVALAASAAWAAQVPDSPKPTPLPDEMIVEASASFIKARQSLGRGDYDSAITLLSGATSALSLIGDHVLFWRAQAYEGKSEHTNALADLAQIRKEHPETPLLKKVRRMEIEIRERTGDGALSGVLEEFVKDYPAELDMKLAYARYLGKRGETQRAKKLLREVYVAASPLSEAASRDLAPAEITVNDLITRGKRLNEAYRFSEGEQSFRAALRRGGATVSKEIEPHLAYALFRQKKYHEAAELYKKTRQLYWYGRSLLRSRQLGVFESELSRLMQHKDKRIASLLISYGNVKRRGGDVQQALSVFSKVAARYPEAREEALWAIGWTHYRAGDYRAAVETFDELRMSYGAAQYRYWLERSKTHLNGNHIAAQTTEGRPPRHQDFYGFVTLLQHGGSLPAVAKARHVEVTMPSRRAHLLLSLGLRDDAVTELLTLSRKTHKPQQLAALSAHLQMLGDFRSALSLISKTPYGETHHDLFYPLAFRDDVQEAARRNGVDPLLVVSVIREESRFDPDAVSVAGAVGLMQLMPATGEKLGKALHIDMGSPAALSNPKNNVLAGALYLAQLLTAFASAPAALAAYNAGEEIVSEWLTKESYRSADEFIEDIPYDETRNYVKRVLSTYMEYLRGAGERDLSAARKVIIPGGSSFTRND